MKTRGRLGWWVLAVVCGGSACGQELALPTADSGKAPTADGAVDGTTGAAGAAAELPPQARLPLPDQPVFTTFGGLGGDDMGGAADVVVGNAGRAGGGGGNGGHNGGLGGGGHGGTASGSGGRAGSSGSAGLAGMIANAAGGGAGGEGGSAGGGGSDVPPSLFFSEYLEGSGSFKALEIYAADAASLEGCELQTYFNGKLEPSRLALHGALARGAVQVLCSTALATAQPTSCDRSTSLTFNGDDALALSCGGVLLDVIGQIGVDPGDAWGDGATADHTLRRRCSVTSGRRDGSQPFDPNAEWLVFGADVSSDLGAYDCSSG